MYVPIPILVAASFVFLVLLLLALGRRGSARRDLITPPPAAAPPPASTQAEIASLLAAGKKIEAIRLVREVTGLGLKEAKDFVDARRQMGME